MAEIVPFRGIFYNTEKVKLEKVVAPPYDVIAPEEQEALYAASPYNCVRLILNRPEPGDDETNNPYTRAAGFLREWLASGVLREDDAPALYVYRQEFTNPADGARYARTGLFCALRLEPYEAGVVLPHEETRTGAKEDRLRLMRATRANPEPIFGLYEDPEGIVARALNPVLNPSKESDSIPSAPDLRVTVDGDRHHVRRIDDPETQAAIQDFLRDRRVWIADGHHRYETALTYRNERRVAEYGGRGVGEWGSERPHSPAPLLPYDYILIVLTAFEDPGVVVLPTHRLVKNISPGRQEQLLLQLERYFTIEMVPLEDLPTRMIANPAQGLHRFGMVGRVGAWVLTLRDESVMDTAVEGPSVAWKRLDVSILQTLVLDRSLGIPTASLATTPDVGYTRDREEAVASVRSGDWQYAFLLNLPTADEVRQVAAAGDKMPPKSTYFYPKLWSGLIMRVIG